MRHTALIIPSKFDALRHVAGSPPRERFLWCGRSLLGPDETASAIQGREIVWSGSYAEVEGRGPFDEDPRTWGTRGWEALHERVAQEAPGSLVLRPHARHVVSDVPGCRRLLESEWGRERGIHLCYDPVGMLAPGMLSRAEDHLRRSFEALELISSQDLSMVVVAGVDSAGTPCGIHECGDLGRMISALAAEWIPPSAAIALLDDRVGAQLEMLAQAGA